MFKRIKNINIKAKIFQIIKKIQDSNLIGLLKFNLISLLLFPEIISWSVLTL